MCEMRGYSPREFKMILDKNGWKPNHQKGTHCTYIKDGMSYHITFSDKGKELSRPLVKRIIKEAHLVV
jgi:predicted RNA binding protein YcfA (HicA-like mRNA interferase family)